MGTFLFALLVAGISISFVFLVILVIVGVWYARKKSKVSPSFYLRVFVYVCIFIYIIEYEVSASQFFSLFTQISGIHLHCSCFSAGIFFATGWDS